MNKNFQKILATLLAVSFTHFQIWAESIRYSNKTFLMPRSFGVNLALENGAGWNEFKHYKVADRDAFGGKTQSVSFYQASDNETGLGAYFGINNKNNLLGAIGSNALTPGNNVDFDLGLIIHAQGLANAIVPVLNPSATNQALLKLTPNQKAYGVYYTYEHDLSKAVNGLYFRAVIPFVHVENSMDLVTANGLGTNLQDFLNGNYQQPVGNINAQDYLKNAIINGTDGTTGVSDVDLMVGYNIDCCPDLQIGLNVGLTIPTGTRVTGENAFQAIVGNGRHFGLGGNLDIYTRFGGDEYHHAALQISANYRYLFDGKERRTLGLTGQNFGQYTLLLQNQQNPTTGVQLNTNQVQLIPAANVLTQDVNVFPGSQFDAIAALTYYFNGLSFDVGYNFYYRDAETVSQRQNFDPTQYGIALQALDMSAALAPINLSDPAQTLNGPLTQSSISTDAAATPAQSSHKIYGGLSFLVTSFNMPFLLGVGGHYEFAAYNNMLETWGVNGKVGFSF